MYIYMCPSISISVHNDIEMKGDPDTVTLPIPNCIAKDIFAGAIKEEDERDFTGDTPIFGIAPATTADYPVAAPPNDHKLIDDAAGAEGGGFDENSVSSECSNHNNIANNNNNNNNNLMKRKLIDFVDGHAEDEFSLVRPPPKRVSPFLNTPKQRKDERKRILRLSVYKLREMEDPESFLRKSVLINNVLRRLHKEIREEKRGYAGFGLGCATAAMSHPYYRPRRFDYDMLNNSHLPTRAAFFFDEPCFPGETERITDDMTDSLVRSLEASSPPPPTHPPLSLSPLSSTTLQLPGTPHHDISSTSTAATSPLTSPLTTATDSALATTASAITTIITTTTLPSQLSTTTTTSSDSEEDMLLGNDNCPSNDVSVDSISTDVTTSSVTNNSTVVVDVSALSSSINRNNISSSRTNSSNSHNYGTNKPIDISRTLKSEATANVVIGALGCSPTSDNNNNKSNVCNANGGHVFGTSVPVDHVISPIATSRTSTLNNNVSHSSSSDVTSTNSSVLFSTTNFGSSGFLSVSGSTPYSVGSFVSSTTTATMMTSAANTVPSLAFQEKQISMEMDTMFNNLIRVLGET